MIEIGCGNGHFLEDYAFLHPETNCLGIDLRLKRIEKGCRKADRGKLSNLRFMLGDGFAILAKLPSAAMADRVAVNFPDPWPKFRHRDNRLNRAAAIAAMLARIAPGGDFVWVCDYYPQIVDVIMLMQPWLTTGEFVNHFSAEGYGEGLDGYPRTLYERRWRAMGRRIYYLRFCRRG
jgi:tRNA (guanine-N7-)-methyltransferase